MAGTSTAVLNLALAWGYDLVLVSTLKLLGFWMRGAAVIQRTFTWAQDVDQVCVASVKEKEQEKEEKKISDKENNISPFLSVRNYEFFF